MATGFWQGASQGYDKGSTLGAQMYRDLMAQKEAEKANKAAMERQSMLDQRYDSERLNKDYQFEQELALKKQALNQKPGGGTPAMPMTPGRKSADMAFGKDYVDWTGGGIASAEKGLNSLRGARQQLMPKEGQVRDDISGGLRGKFPDFIRSITNPEAVAVKDTIRGAVMNTLKATLGSQFTNAEGERIFNLAYNDQLPEAENIKKLDAVLGELETMYKAKQSQAEHFEQQGTLTGWQGGGDKLAQDAMMIMNDPEATPEEKAWAQSKLGK